MCSDQLLLNDFEKAVLQKFAEREPAFAERITALVVKARKFTGVGSKTDFVIQSANPSTPRQILHLLGAITMPGVPGGLGAALLVLGDEIDRLDIYTFGADLWDGGYDGFQINEPA